MPRRLIKRYLPDSAVMKNHKHLRHLGALLRDDNLWHLNRRSAAGAAANGLFWAMIPLPSQMLISALTAIGLRINLPISVILVWVSNPFTMPPLFYFNYLVGTWLLGKQVKVEEFHLSLDWLASQIHAIWKPLYLGSLVVGALFALLGYGGVRLAWRWHVVRRLKARLQRVKPAKAKRT